MYIICNYPGGPHVTVAIRFCMDIFGQMDIRIVTCCGNGVTSNISFLVAAMVGTLCNPVCLHARPSMITCSIKLPDYSIHVCQAAAASKRLSCTISSNVGLTVKWHRSISQAGFTDWTHISHIDASSSSHYAERPGRFTNIFVSVRSVTQWKQQVFDMNQIYSILQVNGAPRKF